MGGKKGIVAAALTAWVLLAPTGGPPPAPTSASAGTTQTGFQDIVAFSGLTEPTVLRFSPDGRVFVAEKSGLIKVFDGLSDTTPTVFADLRTKVFNYWDRGLLGMALDPNFPTSPYVYVLYSYDHVLGDSAPAPRWGTAGATSDNCPTPPGPTTDGCVTSGRISRLQVAGNVMTGSEQVLVEDWCNQFQTHSIGTLQFGPDGALYASGGDGGNADVVDYGQKGNPVNPCGDPPGGVGSALTPPTAEGGALRSQDLRTTSDPTTLDGSIIRIDPATGAAFAGNPLAASPDANARRIIAYGLRNPFRFAFRPGTNEIWVGDVGWNDYEEINTIANTTDSVVENFGWPCYEGPNRQAGYDAANLNICENLYATPSAVTSPFFAYSHAGKVVSGESCPSGSSSLSGMAFEFAPTSSSYPTAYQRALYFADYSRNCIWVMKKDANGVPAKGLIETFDANASSPVDLEFGPGGELYYADLNGGTIHRITYSQPPGGPPAGTTYLSDLAWTSMTNGWGPVEKDKSNGEDNAGDGSTLTLNTVTYPKGLGAHAVSDVRYNLGGSCSRFKASVGIDDEVPGTGGTVVFQVWGDATKLYDSGVMNAASATKSIDISVAGTTQLRLVVTNGGDNFVQDHADWALARIECGTTSGLSVVQRSPAAGATGVPLTTKPSVTFSTAINAATLTTSTFTLVRQGTTTPVSATVSYDAPTVTATLTPSASLQAATTYTATVTGGSNGVKDAAGNALAADDTWSFTTATAPNNAPLPVIDSPLSSLTWKVGDAISFSGHASDPEQGSLPASALSWALVIQHCPSNCHSHTIQSWTGVANGTFDAPDHEYPSYLELRLTATDAGGASGTTTMRLDPKTVVLSFGSIPIGLELAVNSTSSTAPFTRTVIVGSTNTVSATTPQSSGGTSYEFSSWSDGGAQTHTVVAPSQPATYTASFATAPAPSSTYLSDLSWTSMTNGWGPVEKDKSNGEDNAGDGSTLTLNTVTYPKGLGAHAASDVRYNLPSSCSRFKASVGIDDEVPGTGGTVVFQVWGDATKLYDSGVMNAASATKSIDISVAGTTQLRLVVTNGGDNFVQDHADWALARIECGTTSGLSVVQRSPAAGATGVPLTTKPSVTFSTAINAATLTTSTFTLVRQGTTTPVSATVSYDAPTVTATLTPSASLQAATTYTATVTGGSNGVKDAAGNALAADDTWSFTTATAPPTSSYLSDLAWTSMTNGWGPVEKDKSNGEDNAGDGSTLTLNTVTYPKGLGAHAVSDVRYNLGGSCSRFKASVGIDDEVPGTGGTVVFQVWGDATKLYDSGVMNAASATKSIDISVAGTTQLRLVVTNGGDNFVQDHADWALARIEC